MAELVAKKSSNVVSNNSNKKNSDVCSVQSNNGLIDLDNITSSNNQLITLCDEPDDEDDLIMTRNTKNELSPEDKSLQEMIESELALRICSANDDDVDLLEAEEDEASQSKPEVTIKKIILEPRPDPLDINAEFIGAEMEHYTIVEDPYTYRNGHTSPGSGESRSPERPQVAEDETTREEESSGPLEVVERTAYQGLVEDLTELLHDSEAVRPEDDVVEDEILVRSEVEPDWSSSVETFKTTKNTLDEDEALPQDENSGAPPTLLNKHRQEENDQSDAAEDEESRLAWTGEDTTENQIGAIDESTEKKNLDYQDVWLDREASSETNGQVGNFSDDFAVCSRREVTPIEPEEPEDDQHRDFEEKSSNYNPSADADEDSKAEADIGFTSEKCRRTLIDNVVEVEPVVDESEKTLDSCPSADDSQIEVPTSDVHVDKNDGVSEEIALTRCFIGEECIALVRENHRVGKISEDDNREPEVNDFDVNSTDFLADDGEVVRLEKDARVFGDDVKSSEVTSGVDGEPEESESSWMTVEEATNDRNKLAETMNEREPSEEANDQCRVATGDDSAPGLYANTVTSSARTTTTNGLVDVASEPEINFVATARPDDSSCNPTKIDYPPGQDSTPTNSSRLSLTNEASVAPLATPDDESSELSNVCYVSVVCQLPFFFYFSFFLSWSVKLTNLVSCVWEILLCIYGHKWGRALLVSANFLS